MDLLWRHVDEGRARNAFRQALHRLRGAIGDELLPQDRERLRLIRSPRIQIDLDRFEAAVAAGRLAEALELYRGDFLEGVTLDEPPFDMWVEQERTRLRTRFRRVLEDSIAQASAAGQWNDAIARARRLVATAPLDPGATLAAATTLVSAGRRGDARELLKQFGSALNAELGVPLPSELQTLLARIERQSDQNPTSHAAPGAVKTDLPFVGREAELSRLISLCRTAAEDSGGLALLEGEAGLGKTRLVRELVVHAKSLGRVLVLSGRERAVGAQLAYGIFAEALRPLVRAPGIVGASRHLLAEAARLLPELRDEMDLPQVTDVDDDASRLRFFEGVAALIDAAAFEQPILIALEDLQYIAPSSLDLLSYLTVRLAGSAVTFVLSIRAGEAPPALLARVRGMAEPSAVSSPAHGARAQRMTLAPFSPEQAHRAAAIVAAASGLPTATADRVVQRAEGHPGRLAELLRRASAGEDVATLPVSMVELLGERMQRLSSAQRRLLLVIGMIGRRVPVRVSGEAAHLSEAATHDALEALTAEGLVEIDDSGAVAAPPLVARVAIDSAAPASRAFLSAWVAEALASSGNAPAAELAVLFASAGQSGPAFEQARRAAFEALAMGGAAEAVQLFQAARSFAATPEQQSQIESFLAALGTGLRRIAATPPSFAASIQAPTPPTPGVAASVTGSAGPAWQSGGALPTGWERLFPNWRLLLGAAVATLVISAAVLAVRPPSLLPAARSPTADTLVVTDGPAGRFVRFVTGDPVAGFTVSDRVMAPASEPAWMDSVTRPWQDAVADPRGAHVAIARITASGSDLFVMTADRRDTLPLLVGSGDARPLAWSPDGRWLLATVSRTLDDGTFDTDLYALSTHGAVIRRAIDTTARRAVIEAAWSPDGTRIAWVARVGLERQLEVFASDVEGHGLVNLSRHPADDQHITWSPSGDLVAFTSARDGNAELYAASLRENKLWRLTFDPAQDDRAAFSGDARLIAFESTRGGAVGVYVMPALGGDARQIGRASPFSMARWRGAGRYVDRVRVGVPDRVSPGDTARLTLIALDQFEEPVATGTPQWAMLDSGVARLVLDSASGARLVARRSGLARVVGHVGRWRFDTAYVHIGDESVSLLGDTTSPRPAWRPLGVPLPTMTSDANGLIVLRADREWESGMLSRSSVPMLPRLTVAATLELPLGSARDPATSMAISLVAVEDSTAIDVAAPQFLRLVTFAWNADAGRFVYAVGREVFTEAAPTTAALTGLRLLIRIEPDSTVSFGLDGQQRWRSTLRVPDASRQPGAQVWIAGRATGDRVRVGRVRLVLAGRTPNADP